MAETHWALEGIEAVYDHAAGYFTYTAVLDGPSGALRVSVSLDAVLDYYLFQREVLGRGGVLYIHHQIEGRDVGSANARWKDFTDMLLRQWHEQRQAAQAPLEQSGGAGLN